MSTPEIPVHSILHVTNGDSAAHNLLHSGVVGANDVMLPWRDVLHDGPVVGTSDASVFRRSRAAFLASRSSHTIQSVSDDLTNRDATLARHVQQIVQSTAHRSPTPPVPGIVLWFEPDLYDQLQLVQVLSDIADYARTQLDNILPQLYIVPANCMLGTLHPNGFAPLYVTRRTLSMQDFAVGRTTWQSFASGDAGMMNSVLSTYEPLPYLGAAMQRMCEEYPSMHNGLSRTEYQIGLALQDGAVALNALFPHAHHARETWEWLGDTSFAWYVERLSNVPVPLVTFVDGSPVLATTLNSAFWSREVQLTPFGASVLAGAADFVEANGVDRWIGGVHLTAENVWRWSGTQLAPTR